MATGCSLSFSGTTLSALSYLESVETWNTNVMGTIHVLEALKSLTNPVPPCLLLAISAMRIGNGSMVIGKMTP